MNKVYLFCALVFVFLTGCQSVPNVPLRCQKEAEAIAMQRTKEKNNLTPEEMTIAHPTAMEGQDVAVYIGGIASYNYFKLKMDLKCKLVKVVDEEYAD